MESDFHKLMKDSVASELSYEGYQLHVEPLNPPLDRLTWSYYRPDILGLKDGESKMRVVFAECETNPCISRIKGKNTQVKRIVLQTFLDENHELRLILAIPCRMFSRVNISQVRRLWEIWIINQKGRIIYKVN
jgi:hypothetical protein